ncbi:hypothetical protein MMC07_005709 [Pseudocyphellaria aurata]|nr:hypothetical protein [Pseudocyphellaria aurata]
MPSFSHRHRHVDFDLTPEYSRPAHDDETYVMDEFNFHASHCSSCADPYQVHKRGGHLCPQGHGLALDVAQYLYNKGGQAYSVVDREGHQRVKVEIPPGCDAVRGLLKAMGRGLRLRRVEPATSYDRTYYVPPRTIQPERTYQYREPQPIRKTRLETAKPLSSSYSRQQPREKPYYHGRGSLFEEDMLERETRYKSPKPIYYEAAPRKWR